MFKGFHVVINPCESWCEAVNFVHHRWQVTARGQVNHCCEKKTKMYSSKPWRTIASALFEPEETMKAAFNEFKKNHGNDTVALAAIGPTQRNDDIEEEPPVAREASEPLLPDETGTTEADDSEVAVRLAHTDVQSVADNQPATTNKKTSDVSVASDQEASDETANTADDTDSSTDIDTSFNDAILAALAIAEPVQVDVSVSSERRRNQQKLDQLRKHHCDNDDEELEPTPKKSRKRKEDASSKQSIISENIATDLISKMRRRKKANEYNAVYEARQKANGKIVNKKSGSGKYYILKKTIIIYISIRSKKWNC